MKFLDPEKGLCKRFCSMEPMIDKMANRNNETAPMGMRNDDVDIGEFAFFS